MTDILIHKSAKYIEEDLDYYNSFFIHSFNSEEIEIYELFEKNL